MATREWISYPAFGLDYVLTDSAADLYYEAQDDNGETQREYNLEESLQWLKGLQGESQVYRVSKKLVAIVRPHVEA